MIDTGDLDRPRRGGEVMPRAEVHWFAERMEAELAENDHKRHWSSCTPGWLLKRLEDEVAELRRAVETGAPAARVISEAADVGNFAMMIADHACASSTGDPPMT